MNKTRAFILAATLFAAGLFGAASPANASSTQRCNQSYFTAVRTGTTAQNARILAAAAVSTLRYGNFGGWVFISESFGGGTSYNVTLRRPGTNLYTVSNCFQA